MKTYRMDGNKLVACDAKPEVFAIVVNNNGKSIDQFVTTARIAERERKDLIKLDCGAVSIVALASWEDADAYEAKVRGYARPLADRAKSRKVVGPYHYFGVQRAMSRGRNLPAGERMFYMGGEGRYQNTMAGPDSLELNLRLVHDWEHSFSWGEFGDSYTPIVALLPHGRGFIPGATMGRGMISWLDAGDMRDTLDDARHAARDYANRLAEIEAAEPEDDSED